MKHIVHTFQMPDGTHLALCGQNLGHFEDAAAEHPVATDMDKATVGGPAGYCTDCYQLFMKMS